MTDTTHPKAIPLARCLELFEYRAETGELLRKVPTGRSKKGDDAVRVQWDPRFQELRTVVWIDGEKYQAPRVLLSMHLGRPVSRRRVVDHRNGDPLDNRAENLREATRTQNQLNRRDNRPDPQQVAAEVDPW